jgi:hydrogenase maturation protein HypF
MAHLKYVPIPSGEKAILEPWRMAYSHLVAAQIDPKILLSTGAPVSTPIAELFDKMIRQEINAPFTSSMGRLFDAVSSMIGIRHRVSYEGQAAIELEWAAQSQVRSRWVDQNYLFDIHRSSGSSPLWVIDPAPVIQSIVSDLKRGVDGPDIAFRFHSAVSRMVGDICARIRDEIGLNQVVLSGGVFMNALLSDGIMTDLEKREFKVFCHSLVPCNDGGICLGQAAVAAAQLNSFKRRLSDVLSDSR